MNEQIYRGLTASDLDFVLDFANKTGFNGLWWLESDDEEAALQPILDRVQIAANQINQAQGESPNEQQ